ncbi:MAG: polyprenyl synthetase family protein [Clostridiales bacterium]|nr:polyprenyl synthetase family protein [Clostridiales bacterium]
MSFKDKLNKKTDEINIIINCYLPTEEGFQNTVIKAMNYSMESGGKRIRPLLMQETYQMFGGQGKVIEPFMAAIEMIHTYSLVHDDLPAMDNDEYRRGKKTTHVQFGEAMGILAGDGLLNYAFETALKSVDLINGDITQIMTIYKALKIFAEKSGIYGMIGGQTVDVESAKNNELLEKDKLDFVYELKTCALIESSMMIGAVLAGANEEQCKKIEQIARDVGLAFQIQDDILDVTSTTGILGKPVLSDEKNNKVTYVTLLGIDEAKKQVEYISTAAVGKLEELKIDTNFIIEDSFLKNDFFLKKLILWLMNREK